MKKPIKPKKLVAPKKPERFLWIEESIESVLRPGDKLVDSTEHIKDQLFEHGMIFDINKLLFDIDPDHQAILRYSDKAKIKFKNPHYENQLKAYEKKLPIYKAKLDLYNKAIEKYNSEMEEYQRLADLKTIEELKKRGFKIELKT